MNRTFETSEREKQSLKNPPNVNLRDSAPLKCYMLSQRRPESTPCTSITLYKFMVGIVLKFQICIPYWVLSTLTNVKVLPNYDKYGPPSLLLASDLGLEHGQVLALLLFDRGLDPGKPKATLNCPKFVKPCRGLCIYIIRIIRLLRAIRMIRMIRMTRIIRIIRIRWNTQTWHGGYELLQLCIGFPDCRICCGSNGLSECVGGSWLSAKQNAAGFRHLSMASSRTAMPVGLSRHMPHRKDGSVRGSAAKDQMLKIAKPPTRARQAAGQDKQRMSYKIDLDLTVAKREATLILSGESPMYRVQDSRSIGLVVLVHTWDLQPSRGRA